LDGQTDDLTTIPLRFRCGGMDGHTPHGRKKTAEKRHADR